MAKERKYETNGKQPIKEQEHNTGFQKLLLSMMY
jgi:hypothetical protein